MRHLNDYELAVELSLHGNPDERRIASAFLDLYEQQRENSEDCPFCGCPSS